MTTNYGLLRLTSIPLYTHSSFFNPFIHWWIPICLHILVILNNVSMTTKYFWHTDSNSPQVILLNQMVNPFLVPTEGSAYCFIKCLYQIAIPSTLYKGSTCSTPELTPVILHTLKDSRMKTIKMICPCNFNLCTTRSSQIRRFQHLTSFKLWKKFQARTKNKARQLFGLLLNNYNAQHSRFF